jgi:hypothetical protein
MYAPYYGLRNIHRNPSRLILAEQLRRRPPTRLVLEIDIPSAVPRGSAICKADSL